MASIVVNGDTSGAVTLSAPAVAGTVTVTLPSANGTMLTTASSTGISGSAISSGTVAEAYGGTGTSVGYNGFKNRIINGAMVIDQRNAGASVTPANGAYTLDRWQYEASQASKFTVQQNAASVTPPAGYKNYLGMTVASAVSVGAGDYFILEQRLEGLNVYDLAWGTASASSVTLSFWVRSSLTGTFSGGLANSDYSRAYVFSYSISAANTWEQKSITIAGDTTGTWLTTNGIGIQLRFSLGAGSTYSASAGSWGTTVAWNVTGGQSVVGTSGATFYITGVQLEKGSTATSFDYRPYGTEFSLCQRYFQKSYNQSVVPGTASTTVGQIAILANNSTFGEFLQMRFPVTMRASPTMVTFNPSSGTSGSIRNNTASTNVTASINNSAESGLSNLDSALTSGSVFTLQYTASAEL